MSTQYKIRFIFLAALWLVLCYLVISSQPFTLWVLFVIIASGIVVWAALYKKYIKNGKGKDER